MVLVQLGKVASFREPGELVSACFVFIYFGGGLLKVVFLLLLWRSPIITWLKLSQSLCECGKGFSDFPRFLCIEIWPSLRPGQSTGACWTAVSSRRSSEEESENLEKSWRKSDKSPEKFCNTVRGSFDPLANREEKNNVCGSLSWTRGIVENKSDLDWNAIEFLSDEIKVITASKQVQRTQTKVRHFVQSFAF